MIRFLLNSSPVSHAGPADRTLAAILREDLGLTGTKLGCAIGRGGACTVLLDGAAVIVCLVMAWQVGGRAVVTIEGRAAVPAAAPVAAALAEENAFQCGYCAPGITLALAALFTAAPDADDEAVVAALEGHLCRCTGDHAILRAARAARSAVVGGASTGSRVSDPGT